MMNMSLQKRFNTIEKLVYYRTIRLLEKREQRKLNSQEKEAVALYTRKQTISKKYLPRVRKIYNDIISDYLSIYKVGEYFNYELIKTHFKGRFVGILTEIYNNSSKVFGRLLRDQLGFSAYGLKAAISAQEDINERYDREVSVQILENVDRESDRILNTVVKDLQDYTDKGIQEYNQQLKDKESKLAEVLGALALLAVGVGIMGSTRDKQINNLQKNRNRLTQEIENMQASKNKMIKNNIRLLLKSRFKSRSTTTTDQEVGISESMVRTTEGAAITAQPGDYKKGPLASSPAVPFSKLIKDTWIAILDRRTRQAHAQADGEARGEDGYYIVGGERLKNPRDPNGSPENVINCRCESISKINYG